MYNVFAARKVFRRHCLVPSVHLPCFLYPHRLVLPKSPHWALSRQALSFPLFVLFSENLIGREILRWQAVFHIVVQIFLVFTHESRRAKQFTTDTPNHVFRGVFYVNALDFIDHVFPLPTTVWEGSTFFRFPVLLSAFFVFNGFPAYQSCPYDESIPQGRGQVTIQVFKNKVNFVYS